MAVDAPNTGAPSRASEINRRNLLSCAAAGITASAIALPVQAMQWRAVDWLTRWHRLGCGAHLDRHGNLQLTPRTAELAASGILLAELHPSGRMEQLRGLLLRAREITGPPRTAQRRAILASEAADRRFAALPGDLEFTDHAQWKAEEDRMIAAWDAVISAPPADWHELVWLLSFITDGGTTGMTEEASASVMRHARWLDG